MLMNHTKPTSEIHRLQEFAAIRLAAKHRAEQLRQEAINTFSQNISAAIRKVIISVLNLGK